MGGWADLFPEILALIFQRLLLSDLFRCSAVCISWDAAVRYIRRYRFPLLNQTPWLLLWIQEKAESSGPAPVLRRRGRVPNTVIICYSLAEDQIYHVPLWLDPLIKRPSCIGSSPDGWAILVDDRSHMLLLNPITGACIDNLPTPLPSFPLRNGTKHGPVCQYYYSKAALSSKPSRLSYAVMLITKGSLLLSYARSGDSEWTLVSDQWIDVTFDDSKGVFYAIAVTGLVQVWDLNLPSPVGLTVGYGKASQCCFLSPSPSGDILQINVEDMNYPNILWPTFSLYYPNSMAKKVFRVYKTDGDESGTVNVRNLGDYTYFIGGNNPICLSSADFPELRPNCIYSAIHQISMGCICIYNLEENSAKNVGIKFATRLPRIPSWFTPSFN